MATIVFSVTDFRAMFPAFTDAVIYPDSVLQLYFDMATSYINPNILPSCYLYAMSLGQQTLALYLMTAHLAYLNGLIAGGTTPGIVQSSTIDKVSVSLVPPPGKTQFDWWMNLSPYGAQLLALLSLAGAGGMYFGGYPVVSAFRR